MTIPPQPTWSGTYRSDIPPDTGNLWKINLCNWLDSMVNSLIQLNGMLGPGLQFIFNKSVFLAGLDGIASVPTPNGIQKIADAWQSSMSSSTWTVPAGSYIGAPTPTTTFGPVPPPVATPDAGTLASGKNIILTLLQSVPVADAALSEFPVKLRDATLGITVTTVGVDSTPTPAGPLPLNDPARPVI